MISTGGISRRDAEEMARLARRLGHPFEATIFLTAALADEPDRTDLRADLDSLNKAAPGPVEMGRTLFDWLGTDCGDPPPNQ